MSVVIPESVFDLLDNPEYGVISTIEPDGSPQSTVVWVARDGNDLLVSTAKGRRKHLNLVRDPRCSVMVISKENPYHYVEVRGTVTITEEGGRELIDRLALEYLGADRYTMDDGTDNVRVVLRVTPLRVLTR